MSTENNIERLEEVTKDELETPDVELLRTNDVEEEFFGEGDEIESDENEEFAPTHLVGDIPVMKKWYVKKDGSKAHLPYYVDKSGRKRKGSKQFPLRPYVPPIEDARKMWLPLKAFALCCSVLITPEDHVEDEHGNIAKRVDAEHVLLSASDKSSGVLRYKRYMVQIPVEISVAGIEINS